MFKTYLLTVIIINELFVNTLKNNEYIYRKVFKYTFLAKLETSRKEKNGNQKCETKEVMIVVAVEKVIKDLILDIRDDNKKHKSYYKIHDVVFVKNINILKHIGNRSQNNKQMFQQKIIKKVLHV